MSPSHTSRTQAIRRGGGAGTERCQEKLRQLRGAFSHVQNRFSAIFLATHRGCKLQETRVCDVPWEMPRGKQLAKKCCPSDTSITQGLCRALSHGSLREHSLMSPQWTSVATKHNVDLFQTCSFLISPDIRGGFGQQRTEDTGPNLERSPRRLRVQRNSCKERSPCVSPGVISNLST